MKHFFSLISLLALLVTAQGQLQKNIEFVGQLRYNVQLSNIWGWTSAGGREYALVGLYDGISIVDLQNPAQPVELQHIPGGEGIWREIATYGNYAYVANETSGGLQIVDLSSLPGQVRYKDTVIQNINTIHTIRVFGNLLFMNGPDNFNGGMAICDLSANPWRPAFVGSYSRRYVHDMYARNGRAYLGEINSGRFTIVDYNNLNNITELGSYTYLNSFTHNTWLNDAGTACFTTDERNRAWIYAWDITDPSDAEIIDGIQTSYGNGESVPHNVHVLNDYLVTSYYKDGVQIVDASRPHNLIETGYYDTSPLSGGGFEGAWGVYPYFPSGLIIVSDMQEGLFVLRPNYQRGCHLEGTVTDAVSGLPIQGAFITASAKALEGKSNPQGGYAVGIADSGTYVITFSKFGYLPSNRTVSLKNGQLNILNVQLQPAARQPFSFNVIDAVSGQPISGADVAALAPGNEAVFGYKTNAAGSAAVSSFTQGAYQAVAGKWGYVSKSVPFVAAPGQNSVTITLEKGYYDDFLFNNGWTESGDASAGKWTRATPAGTDLFGNPSNPGADLADDFGDKAFVTGNSGMSYSDDDVDNGTTILTSPPMDLSDYQDPYLSYYWWFLNYDLQLRLPGNDYFKVEMSDGVNTLPIQDINNPWENRWNPALRIRVKDYFPVLTPNMRLIVSTADDNPQNIVEAGFDGFKIVDSLFVNTAIRPEAGLSFGVWPNPVQNRLRLDYRLRDISQSLTLSISNVHGVVLKEMTLNPSAQQLTIDFPWPAGMYNCTLRSAEGAVQSLRVVKTR